MRNFLALIILFNFAAECISQSFSEHNYTYSDSVYINPERGFYRYTERSDENSVLSVSTLTGFREQGYTLIYRIFYMRDFVNSPISNTYLEKITEDFTKIRTAGIKAIVRFAYTSSMDAPYGDASPERVNQHIQQLAPILRDNSDVILVLQAGFIGAWGEWYYTDHFSTGSPDNVTDEDLQERKILVNNLLEALPEDRMIQLRYVGYKMKLFDSVPVTAEEAYSGTPKSRISHHNDCFVSSSNDVGSYRYIVYEKNYLEQDSKYTSIGGETCQWYEPRSNCDTSLFEMARFHWTYINQDYFGETINEWQNDGCYPVMQKKLGYRYFLVNSSIQDSTKPNGVFNFTFTIKNTGFSNPINYRGIEVVLQNIQSGEKFFAPIDIDIRKFELNTNIDISAQIGVPSYIPYGDYKVYLNLPDPKFAIKNNPDYSVRLANENVWNASIGMNSFNHILHIDSNYSIDEPYSGSNYFLSFEKIPSYNIKIDGDPSDWNTIDNAGSNLANSYLKTVKINRLSDTIYVLLEGDNLLPNSQIFIDADFNSSTGMNYWLWANDGGIDYMVQNNELHRYSGANGSGDWSWALVSNSFLRAANDTVIELALPENLFSQLDLTDSIRFGAVNLSSDWSTTVESVPASGNNLIVSNKALLNAPNLYVSSYANNIIVSYAFAEEDTNAVMVIERSNFFNNNFQTLSVNSNSLGKIYIRDSDLAANTDYYYRAYVINSEKYSTYSSVKTATTSTGNFKYPVISVDGEENDWIPIAPTIAVSERGKEWFVELYCSSEYLSVLFSGDSISDFAVFLNTDDNILTGEQNINWNNSGFEYKITSGEVFKYTAGTYSKIGDIDSISFGLNGVEIKVPFETLEIDNNKSKLNVAAIATANGHGLFFPYKDRKTVLYERVLPSDKPENLTVRQSSSTPSSKLIASWDKCNNCDGFEVVRTNKSTGIKTTFDIANTIYQLIDDNLPANTSFEYTVNSYNFSGKSDIAGPVEMSTSLTDLVKNIDAEKISIWPNPASDVIHIKIPGSQNSRVRINILNINGEVLFSREVELVSPENSFDQSLSAIGLKDGVYLMRIDLQNAIITKKLILRK